MAVPHLQPEHNFTFAGDCDGRAQQWFADGLKKALINRGLQYLDVADPGTSLVINFIDARRPRLFRRHAQATFVCSVVETDERPADLLRTGYPLLVRSMSNLLVYLINDGKQTDAHLVTLEQGTIPLARTGADADFFHGVVDRLLPLATSRLVVNNQFHPDLPEPLWQGDVFSDALRAAGRRLDALGLLPTPFPIQQLLPARDYHYLQKQYGIGGLSYGNLSVRRNDREFWMSASGIDKGNMQVVGRDMLLVTGYDEASNAMVLSVPPDVPPRRVSVDAIEHWMIYTEQPAVGAIIHIHAWMDGVPSTQVTYPCGTWELARAVAEHVRQAPIPSRAVIGLRNHGLTITGHSPDEIFRRIEGRIIPRVPMT